MAVASSDGAATWAHRILGAKNSLTELSPVLSVPQPSSSLRARQPVGPAGTAAADGIDKSRLARPEPRRFRDKEHVRFVAKQPCLICGRRPADPHHLRFAQHRALGRKVSDEFTVPLCRPSSRGPSLWRRSRVVEEGRHPVSVPAPFGWRRIRCRQLRTKWASTARPPWPLSARIRVPPSVIGGSANEARMTKRTQLSRLTPNDFLSTDRGEPSQCS